MKVFLIPSCCERFALNLDLNSATLSKCNILGKPNFNVLSENNFLLLTLSFGVVMKKPVKLHTAVKTYRLPCEVMLYGPQGLIDKWYCGICAMSWCRSINICFCTLII